MNHIKIIAFAGLPMVGKSTARELLEQLLDQNGISHDYVHFGATEEVERRNNADEWNETQKHLTMAQKEQYIRELWRSEGGMGVMAVKMFPTIHKILNAGSLVLIDNMYSDEERVAVKEEFGEDSLLLIAVAADWKVRVERASKREYRPLTEAELVERDKAEIYNLHKAPTIALAQFTIVNNGQSLDVLRQDLSTRVMPELI
jgi:dephospho-CoA kinase